MTFYSRLQPEGLRLKRFNHQLEAMLPELFRLASALTGKRVDAEDLVHDACVKALTSCLDAKLPNTEACRAWVRQILVNTFRDRYRREQRSPIRYAIACDHGEEDNIIEFAEGHDPSPEDWTVYSQLEATVRVAVGGLPPEVRLVAMLYMVSELSYKEIAATIGCPIGTVMSRLSRGRRLLRETLKPDNDKEGVADAARTLGQR